MIAAIVRWCFSRPAVAVLLAAAGTIVGALSFQDLRRDVFPDLATPVFNVIVQNPAMGAEELETGIAVPMEVALAGLPDVRRIRSVSQLGVAQITVEFQPEADYYRSRQFVAERLAQLAGQLPPGTDAPLLSSLTGRLNEIFELTLEADEGAADLMTLRDLAEFEIKNRLLAVPGVSAVERLGGYLRQFQVQLDPDRMIARSVTLEEVLHAVDESNVNASGGFVAQGALEWTIRAVGRAEGAADLQNTVVAVRGSVPVLLADVADVREAPATRRGLAHRLRGEVVSCRVVKQFGADTMAVAAGIRRAIDELRAGLPRGVQLRVVYDQSRLVESALGGVGRAVLLGAVFVVLVLLAFLGNVRAALIVTLTIPCSIALAGLLLDRFDVGLNTMTLGGLAIAVGLLVDASIIVVENVLHRLREPDSEGSSHPPLDRARRAAVEVGRPIAFTTLIVVAVFVPLFAMTGIEGRMYRPLAAAVIATLLASLGLALTVTPVAAGYLLHRALPSPSRDTWIMRRVKGAYGPLLDVCLRRSGTVAVASTLIALAIAALGLRIGTDFMPALDEGAFLLQTVLPPEASLEEVDRLNHRVEDALRKFPEVEDVVRRTGRAERTEDPMPHTLSDVLVSLKPDRSRTLEDLEAAMREAVSTSPGVSVLFTTPLGMRIDEGLGGTPADLSVRIFGPDLDTLRTLAAEARDAIEGVQGIADLRVEPLTRLPQLRIRVNRRAAARVGLAPGDVVRAVRVGLVGEEASEVWVGQRRFDLLVRLQDAWRSDPSRIGRLLVNTHAGVPVPLSTVANVEEAFGPGAIRREAGARRIAIDASVAGRDLGSTAADVRRHLANRLELPAGYFVDVGGRVESQAQAARSLAVATAVAVFAVVVLLYLALGSFGETFMILATLPTAFVGAVVALSLSGETWNVSSLVGLIGLFGIAVQNGLVLATQTHGLVAEGVPFADAVREASLGRLRPKLMTAGTAILGLLPILVLRFDGTEIERPLAVVMVGGLITSTLFTLLVLPAFYTLLDRRGARGQGPGLSQALGIPET
ncbi:MAG: CusA/CzcA family heavy metal efflux RND transporter [Luteitalea sp.]|nr:CusA/CzcA family heavy metal efflux RND transporter [Luteitalea sp.]